MRWRSGSAEWEHHEMVLWVVASLLTVSPVDPRVIELWGAERVRRLQAPDMIELFRVEPHVDEKDRSKPRTASEVIGGYRVTGRRGGVSRALAAPLVAALLDRSTYAFPPSNVISTKFCGGLHAGVAVRFTDATGATEVLLCFQCADVGWVTDTPDDAAQLNASDLDPSPWGIQVADMHHGWARLLDAVIELYPDDEDLKAVRENDRREREHRELEKEFGR